MLENGAITHFRLRQCTNGALLAGDIHHEAFQHHASSPKPPAFPHMAYLPASGTDAVFQLKTAIATQAAGQHVGHHGTVILVDHPIQPASLAISTAAE
jgi:hypothetical protein